jgi:hypothetical protein
VIFLGPLSLKIRGGVAYRPLFYLRATPRITSTERSEQLRDR